MDYLSFCKLYFSVTHIPISLLKKMEQFTLLLARFALLNPLSTGKSCQLRKLPISIAIHLILNMVHFVLQELIILQFLVLPSASLLLRTFFELICMRMQLPWNIKKQLQSFSVPFPHFSSAVFSASFSALYEFESKRN